MPRSFAQTLNLLVAIGAVAILPNLCLAKSNPVQSFPVSPHNNVTIEWWYVNAHVKASTGHRYAVIGSFFRFGNNHGQAAIDSGLKVRQSYYFIYALTDLDSQKHYTYSFGDRNTLDLLQQAATMELAQNPQSSRAQALVDIVDKNEFPPPTRLISSTCSISATPFAARYGSHNAIWAVKSSKNEFVTRLSAGPGSPSITLSFAGLKSPMLVNGDGDTGLRVRTDMKYVSLTRCAVKGTIDLGQVSSGVTGDGWFDHQWGDSWTTQNAGWDWWGVQLANGTDILFFRQLNLKDGKPFFPCATFEDKAGHQTTTHNIIFNTDPARYWTSPATKTTYPLGWTVSFPDQHVSLDITPDMDDQEMPVMASGGAIWEGSCSVDATVDGTDVAGKGYMELVGYASPAVHASIR